MLLFFKQKTAYGMRISDWSSDVCSSDLTLCAWRGSMTRVLMPFPADAVLAGTINQPLQARIAPVAWRHFPDGESLVTLDDALDGADVAILASLRNADAMALPLRFRSEEHTSELQSLMRISYAVFCLKKKKQLHRT